MWALLLLPLLALPAASQEILQYGNGNLPNCAQGCTALTQAQAACVPVPATQKSCFCQSAYLTQQTGDLFKDANAVCSQVCPDQQDRNSIQAWYKNYCAGVNPEAGQAQPTSASPTSATAAPTSTSSSSGTKQPFQFQTTAQPSWWSEHAKWVAMVIVLVVAFVIIVIVGVWWKKRHDRRVNRAAETPLPDGWGPPSDPHMYAATGEKKQSGVTSTTRPNNTPSKAEMGKARRLKKLVGR